MVIIVLSGVRSVTRHPVLGDSGKLRFFHILLPKKGLRRVECW